MEGVWEVNKIDRQSLRVAILGLIDSSNNKYAHAEVASGTRSWYNGGRITIWFETIDHRPIDFYCPDTILIDNFAHAIANALDWCVAKRILK